MVILDQSEFDNVKGKIKEKKENCPTFAYSVLDGYIRGKVYADSNFLKTVLIGTNSGIYFVAGEINNLDFNNFLFELHRQSKVEKSRFTLFSSSENWNFIIKNMFKDEIKEIRRLSYKYCHSNDSIEKKRLLGNYFIEKINAEMIKNSLEFNEKYYKDYWGSISNFIENGFGFNILHNGKIIMDPRN
ncbi:GNAT family N-acetyltransferase [Peribacillus cavernae]|uniref:GNAT family N-acetyltransferase n=1 Tax=Peribacillus cavernae TaxID=1674310 RepID=A0A3S0TZP8_9BACI|nr:GNAT family N-acetyltransferase [Peribacillus cavernae]MDQ0220658.1 hypothetical protein [Peribacillus cavernae]RUQ31114.1 GNAT family N-acetyltransferase [Peribacillus cavernae]